MFKAITSMLESRLHERDWLQIECGGSMCLYNVCLNDVVPVVVTPLSVGPLPIDYIPVPHQPLIASLFQFPFCQD